MRAAVLGRIGGPLEVEEVDLLPIAHRRVLVKTHASPFCSTDVTNTAGRLGKIPPTILGHASIGEVVELGADVTKTTVGARVVVPGTPECGVCYYCAAGRPDQCAELFDLGGIYPDVAVDERGRPVSCAGCVGGYAEYMSISENQVFPVDSTLGSDVLALLGCGATTGYGAVVNAAQVRPGESVAVVGAGHLGLWMIQFAALADPGVLICVEPHAGRRRLAAELGATHVVDPGEVDAVEAVRSLTGGRGADVVLEASGAPHAQRTAVLVSRRAGRVVLTGLQDASARLDLPQVPVAVQSRTLISCQNGNVRMRRDIPRIVSLLERGLVTGAPLITHRYRLDEINTALAASASLDDLSALIVLDESTVPIAS